MSRAPKTAAQIEWPIDRVERRRLADLKDHPQNPRNHSQADVVALARDMKRVGWTYPIVIDEHDLILAGHRRKMSAVYNGWEEGPTIVLPGLSEAEKLAEVIRDNKRGLDSPFDDTLLKQALGSLKAADFDMRFTGFTPADLEALAKPGDFLADLLGQAHDGNDGVRPAARGVAIRFDMLPDQRDTVITWLAGERDLRGLRTSAEALAALANEALMQRRSKTGTRK